MQFKLAFIGFGVVAQGLIEILIEKQKLLEEKYKAQKELFKIAKDDQELYFDMIEQFARELYKENNWNLVFSKRQGGFEEDENAKKALG